MGSNPIARSSLSKFLITVYEFYPALRLGMGVSGVREGGKPLAAPSRSVSPMGRQARGSLPSVSDNRRQLISPLAMRGPPTKRFEPQARAEAMAGKGESGGVADGPTPRIGRMRAMIFPVTGTAFQPEVRKP